MGKLNKEDVLAGTVNVAEVNINDIRSFVKESGLSLKFKNGTPIAECLNAICDGLESTGPVKEDNPDTLSLNDKPGVAQKPKSETFLDRRRASILAAQRVSGSDPNQMPGINPEHYADVEKVPNMIQRRYMKEA